MDYTPVENYNWYVTPYVLIVGQDDVMFLVGTLSLYGELQHITPEARQWAIMNGINIAE